MHSPAADQKSTPCLSTEISDKILSNILSQPDTPFPSATSISNATTPVDTGSSVATSSNTTDTSSLPRLEKNQKETMTAELIGDIKITFSGDAERDRNSKRPKIVPHFLWRTAYETSVTLSAYTSKDTHTKHREQPKLRIKAENAFQAIGSFDPRQDFNLVRIERHLVWNKKVNPSCLISAFNKLSHAKRRGGYHYDESKRIGQRVFIAQISTDGLVAATVSGTCKVLVEIVTKRTYPEDAKKEITEYVFPVDIPIWVRDPRKPNERSDLNEKGLTDLGAEIWMSVTELRNSNLTNSPKSRSPRARNMICADGHDYEWLATGFIPKSSIIKIMPFDGKVLYKKRTTKIIRSLDSTEPWVWNWDEKMWVLDRAMTNLAEWRDQQLHEAHMSKKRSLEECAEGRETAQESTKRRRLLELNIIRPYLRLS